MEYLIIALFTAFDFLILKWKFEHGRYADFALDFLLLVVILNLFSGSLGGEIIGIISQVMVSLYLLVFPPKFLQAFGIQK